MSEATTEVETVLDELERIAEIAAGILDGEDAKAIVTERAMRYIVDPDPEFRFLSGDYFDVNHAAFLRVKKLLTRLERLGKVPMSGSLWVKVPGGDAVTLAVQNGPHHRWYVFGQIKLETPPEMRQVFRTGAVGRVPPGSGGKVATALGPVRDSLGDVVAAAEFSAPLAAPPPAWS